MQNDSAQAKISLKVLGGYFFDSPCTRRTTSIMQSIRLYSEND